MNSGGLPEMLHCLNNNMNSGNTEMSVLERLRSRLNYFNDEENEQFGASSFFASINGDQLGLGELLVNGAMKPDPGIENGWNNDDDFLRILNYGNGSEFEKNFAAPLPRTVSCPPIVAAAMSSAAGRENSKKRKADKTQNLEVVAEEEKSEEKKMKGLEEESKMTEQDSNSKSSTTTATNSKGADPNTKEEKSKKAAEVPKPDYIHVRARRGQATDSHSLAERVRREKISERMKYLQDLVPGCNKITGKAGMLDEIINYVQSLQRQVEFLSMKLAAINPRLDFDVENYLTKESFPACTSSIPTIGTSSEMVNNGGHLQFNSLGQGVSGSSLEMAVNPMEVTLRRTISAPAPAPAPISIPQTFLDSACLNQIQQLAWDDELYSMEYQQGRSASFISQPFAGLFEAASHVKLEM